MTFYLQRSAFSVCQKNLLFIFLFKQNYTGNVFNFSSLLCEYYTPLDYNPPHGPETFSQHFLVVNVGSKSILTVPKQVVFSVLSFVKKLFKISGRLRKTRTRPVPCDVVSIPSFVRFCTVQFFHIDIMQSVDVWFVHLGIVSIISFSSVALRNMV